MQTAHLKTALKVAELKGYAKAASELKVSPVAVVQQVQAVEREVGFLSVPAG